MKKHTLQEWLIAVRPWSFPASAMPVIVTLSYLFWKYSSPISEIFMHNDWAMGAWALANIIIFHAAGNTWSDYFDFKKSVDTAETSGAKTITGGMFTADEIRKLSIILLIIALAGGIGLLCLTGLPLLWIGLGGLICTVLYPLMKYNALGDIVILMAYAVLPTLGTAYVVTGEILWDVMWIAVPVGLITVAILHANNTRDMITDKNAKIKTFAMEIGMNASKYLYYLEIIIPFVWVTVCAVSGILPFWTGMTVGALIPAIGNIKAMAKASYENISPINSLDEMTAKLQLMFSLMFAVSFLLAGLID